MASWPHFLLRLLLSLAPNTHHTPFPVASGFHYSVPCSDLFQSRLRQHELRGPWIPLHLPVTVNVKCCRLFGWCSSKVWPHSHIHTGAAPLASSSRVHAIYDLGSCADCVIALRSTLRNSVLISAVPGRRPLRSATREPWSVFQDPNCHRTAPQLRGCWPCLLERPPCWSLTGASLCITSLFPISSGLCWIGAGASLMSCLGSGAL